MRAIPRSLFKLIYRPIYSFCQGGSVSQGRGLMSLKFLKENVDREHSYVRKNNEEIGQHLILAIQNGKWNYAKKMLLIININQLQSWFLMRKIAKAINNSCNTLQLESMSKEQISDMLAILVLLRFEPKKLKADSFKGRSSQFDDSTAFISELQDHIKAISISQDEAYFFELMRKLLHTNPLLFLHRREEIEKKILHRLEVFMENKSLLNEILIRGCISNYWTKPFKTELLSKNIPGNYLKALHFEDLQNPTKIEKSEQEAKVKTENEIMNILSGFGYAVEESVLVNGYEVDFMINNRLVVEYNGHHHYIINSKKLFPTAKDRWKQNVLRKRHLIISQIPFSEWKVFRLFEEKRKYIVTKIQNDWLKEYKYTKQEAK